MKKIFILIASMLLIQQSHAQLTLLSNYKKEDVSFNYFQLPVNKKYAEFAYFDIQGSANLLHAANAVKNANLSSLKGIGSTFGGIKKGFAGEKKAGAKIRLMPVIFPGHTNIKINIKCMSTTMVDGGTRTYYPAVDYVVVDEKNGEKLYECSKTFKGTTKYSSLELADNYATEWAKNDVKKHFAISLQHANLGVFYPKNITGHKEDLLEAQDLFIDALDEYSSRGLTPTVKTDIKKVISVWKNVLRNYKAGARKKKEAELNDKNAWTLYYNLTLANTILQKSKAAKKYLDITYNLRIDKRKMTDIRLVKMVEDLKEYVELYCKGIEKATPTLRRYVTDFNYYKNVSASVNTYLWNKSLSEATDLPFIHSFIGHPEQLIDDPYLVSTSVKNKKGEMVNYTIKKRTFPLATSSHRLKIKRKNGQVIRNVRLDKNQFGFRAAMGSILSVGHSSTVFGMTKDVDTRRVNKGLKSQHSDKSTIQYDYNGDILIKSYLAEGKWFDLYLKESDIAFMSSYSPEASNESSKITLDDNYLPLSVNTKAEGYKYKFSNMKYDAKRNPIKAEFSMKNGAKNQVLNYKYKFDEKGNWIECKFGDYVMTRNIQYLK